MESNSGIKKVLSIVGRIFSWIIIAFAVFMMIFTIISVTAVNKEDRALFGFRSFIVLSNSMSPDYFDAGDLIFSKKVDTDSIEVGDVITFQSPAGGNSHEMGDIVTHKISLIEIENGVRHFFTYGTNTGDEDRAPVPENLVLGKYVGKIPKLGHFMDFLKTTPGYIVCILLPFLALILYQGLNCVKLFRKYKREQLEEMTTEREQIEAERAETQKMMAELMALKAQLAQQNANAAPAQPVAPPQETAPAEAVEAPAETAEPAVEEAPAPEAPADQTENN